MKRDIDLVRAILLACEADPTGYAPNPLEVEGYTSEQIGFHVYLMIQAGLLEGGDRTHLGSSSPSGIAQALTWQGYEFLEASRDQTRWEHVRSAARTAGAMSLDVLKSMLIESGTAAAKHLLKLP